MKKTLILAFSVAVSSMAAAETYTAVAPEYTGGDTRTFNNVRAFTMNLAEASFSQTEEAMASLTSVSIELGSAWANTTTCLAIYTVSSTGDANSSSRTNYTLGEFVGYGSLDANPGTTPTFTFTDTTLDTTATYAFVFFKSAATEADYNPTSTGEDFNLTNSIFTSSRLDSKNNIRGYRDVTTTGPGTDFMLTDSAAGQGWSGHAVNATLTFTAAAPTAPVPEPTTATLSLLALAGLAARRRRK